MLKKIKDIIGKVSILIKQIVTYIAASKVAQSTSIHVSVLNKLMGQGHVPSQCSII